MEEIIKKKIKNKKDRSKYDKTVRVADLQERVGKFFADDERELKILKEFRKLKKMTKGLERNAVTICIPLIENIAFCVIELEELRELIKRDGYYETYQNGEHQKGIKKSIASDLYVQIGKNYSMLLGRLKDYLPVGTIESDELRAFEKKHKRNGK